MAQPPKQKQDEAPPSRRGRAASVAADVGRAAETAFARAGFDNPVLVLRWTEIAGKDVARLARPLRFSPKDGVLTLLAEPGAALFLGYESRTLAARINAWLGKPAVRRIKFLQGKLDQRFTGSAPFKPGKTPKSGDPSLGYRGPEGLKAALQSLARWRQAEEDRGG